MRIFRTIIIIKTLFYPLNPSYSDVNHFSLIIVGGPTRGVRDLRAFSFVRLAALTLGSEELFEEAGKKRPALTCPDAKLGAFRGEI